MVKKRMEYIYRLLATKDGDSAANIKFGSLSMLH